jgi:predicted NBD/HSP70 family sugar kinase
VCDLAGRVRARQDVELDGADAGAALDMAVSLHASLLAATGLPAGLIDGVVVGVPGVVGAATGEISLVSNVAGLEGRRYGAELEERLGLPVALENDINLAALGEHWQGIAQGIDDFVFLSIGTGLGAGLVLGGELHRGHHGAAGELDYAFVGAGDDVDPCAGAAAELTERLAGEGVDTRLASPYDTRATFAAARGGDALGRAVVDELARRIALHVEAVAAVVDVALVVLGGGLGANGDLLLEPVRERLRRDLPYPPRVEVSSLGDAAVLTGALAVGRRAALENVFVNRARAARS